MSFCLINIKYKPFTILDSKRRNTENDQRIKKMCLYNKLIVWIYEKKQTITKYAKQKQQQQY